MRRVMLTRVLLSVAALFVGAGEAPAGSLSIDASIGQTQFIRTIEDGTWIQEGLAHQIHGSSLGWRAGLDYGVNEAWSIQARYVNLGTIAIDTRAVGDEDYDPIGHRCLKHCDITIGFHTHDLVEGAELSLSRSWSLADPFSAFARVGGAALYHRLTAQFNTIQLTMHGWMPTALVGGGVCVYQTLCLESTYYRALGGATDWSEGLPISKGAVQTLLTVKVPFSF